MRRTGHNGPHLPGTLDVGLSFPSPLEAVGGSPGVAQPPARGGCCFDAICPFLQEKRQLHEKGSRSDAVTQ